jgi:hypothetical protein
MRGKEERKERGKEGRRIDGESEEGRGNGTKGKLYFSYTIIYLCLSNNLVHYLM